MCANENHEIYKLANLNSIITNNQLVMSYFACYLTKTTLESNKHSCKVSIYINVSFFHHIDRKTATLSPSFTYQTKENGAIPPRFYSQQAGQNAVINP